MSTQPYKEDHLCKKIDETVVKESKLIQAEALPADPVFPVFPSFLFCRANFSKNLHFFGSLHWVFLCIPTGCDHIQFPFFLPTWLFKLKWEAAKKLLPISY